MGFTRESVTEKAKQDLAERLGVDQGSVHSVSVTEKEFPDMSLGAAVDGEVSSQMISNGWEIKLGVDGKNYEYRADKYQLRLVGFKGSNHLVDEVH